jgi:acetoin utilization protein AcuB
MRHPKRSIGRQIRTRRPLHPGREPGELEAVTWPESIRVGDRMTRAVVTIHPDMLVTRAAALMKARRIEHLPIVDQDGCLVGMATDRDLRQAVLGPAIQQRAGAVAEAVKEITVAEVMTYAVVTTRPATPLREAARVMHERKIGSLPVIEDGTVVGILTERDVLKAFQEVLEQGGLAKPYRWAFGYR